MTGRLIEYLEPPEESFSCDTSQLMFTCSLRPYSGVYVLVRKYVCMLGEARPDLPVCECLSCNRQT